MLRFSLVLFLLLGTSLAQSLGEAARAARANKQRTAGSNQRVITNEALTMMRGQLSEATVRGGAADTAGPAATDAGKPASGDASKAGATEKDAAAAAEEEKKKLAEDTTKTQEEIERLTRELDVLQRENRLRAASYYADAGTRLRNEAQFAADSRRYQQDIEAKQNAINAAKQKLAGLQEQARRSGSPVR